jgi:gas vesicle protein
MSPRPFDDEPTVIVERRNGSSAGAFLAGIALGAGLALLLAPQTGHELRRQIRRSARRARRSANELARDLRERAEDAYADARSEVESRVSDAKEAIRDRRQDVTDAVKSGRVAAREARTAFERRLAESRHGRPAADGGAEGD